MAIEYFWETEYKFGEFLKKIFGEEVYKRKYSLEGNGIFNLLYLNGKIYEIKYSQAKTNLLNDNHNFTDDKEFIINTIVDNLKCDKEKIVINGGKFITFPVDKWIAKIEIIKKLKEPK
ncbi:MAG: hypothetical protein ACI4PE_02570 [Bacilli bacterium]